MECTRTVYGRTDGQRHAIILPFFSKRAYKKGRVVILIRDTSSHPVLHSTKYHQKGILVTEQTQNLFQTKQREITLKVRKPELSFL